MEQRPKSPQLLRFGTVAIATLAAMLSVIPASLYSEPLDRSDLQIVARGPNYFEAVLEVPAPVILPGRLGESRAVRLEIPGWISAAPEGSPLLPMRSLAVAVPEGEEVRVSVRGESPVSHSELLLVPFWRRLVENPDLDVFPVESAADEIYGRDAFWPTELHEVGPPVYLRDLRLVPLDIRPAKYNPLTRELVVFQRLRIRVETVRPGDAPIRTGVSALPVDAGGWDRIYRSVAINYPSEMAYRALRERSRIRRTGPEDYFDDSDWWLAIEVVERGIYSISYEELQSAGFPDAALQAMDPSTLRLFNGGGLGLDVEQSVEDVPSWMTECAMHVQDGEDGSFGAGDRVIFYGYGAEGWKDYLGGLPDWDEHLQNLHTGRNVYWLTWGGTFRLGAPLRMQASDGGPVGEGVYEPDAYRERVHVEENREWDPSLRYPGIRWERWWWQLLRMTDTGGRAYRVSLQDVKTGAPCRVKVRFWGSEYVPGCLDHHMIDLSFNGSATFRRGGQGRARIDVDTTAVWAVEGENLLVARIPFVVDPCRDAVGATRKDEGYFAWFELEYERGLRARGGELAFDWTEPDLGPIRFKTYGFTEGSALAFDVTDRYAPRLITNASVSADTVTFQQDLDGSRRNYILVSDGALRSPASVNRRSPGALRGRKEPTDYIIIAGEKLMEAAEVLGDWRRDNLLGITDGGGAAAVEIVDVAEIFDEFSWGMIDPVAIRNFLEYRFNSAAKGERPPSYAVMFGDATWDFRDFYQLGVRSVVASYDEAFDRLTQTQYSSDDFLVLFEGPEDRYSDMAIGRLSPETPTEAMGLVTDKVIGFERNADPGPWRSKIVLAADDACIGIQPEPRGEKHTEQADDLSKRHLPRAFDIQKIYLIEYGGPGCSSVSKPDARRDFIDALDEGAILVNYVGHGSAQVLAQERLFLADDVATLENRTRLGMFVTASCAVGKFDVPLDIGVAEGMVRSNSGGSLAAYGATTLAFVPANKELNGLLADSLLPRPEQADSIAVAPAVTIGQSVLEAEATFTNWYYETPYKYVLLGDPASVLTVPGTAYPSSGGWLRVEVDLNRSGLGGGERDTLSGRIMDGENLAAWFDGKVDVTVEGAEIVKPLGEPSLKFEPYILAGPTFYHGRTDVAGGEFEIAWINPYELVTGNGGLVRALAWNEGRDALGALARLPVTAPSGPHEDEEGPVVELGFDETGDIVTPGASLTVRVSDPSGINLAPVLAENSLFVRLYNEDLNQLVDGPVDLTPGFTYEEGSSSVGSVQYRLPFGLSTNERTNSHRIEVSASDNFSNRSMVRLSFDVTSVDELKLTDVVNYPNPFSASTTIGFRVMKEADVVVKIYTVSGRHVRTLRAPAVYGWGHLVWDAEDSAGDPVSNGVYLYKVTASSTERGGEKATFLGKAVVMR